MILSTQPAPQHHHSPLPNRTRCNIYENVQHVECPKPEDQSLWTLIDQLIQTLSIRFHCWELQEDFRFELPKSLFDHQRDLPTIEFVKPQLQQDHVVVRPLDQEQLNSILHNGTFTTHTQRHNLTAQWQINPWIYIGKNNIEMNKNRNLGTAYSQIYELKQRINGRDFSYETCRNHLIGAFESLADNLVGVRKTSPNLTQNIYEVAEMKKHRAILNKYHEQLRLNLFKYLSVDFSEKDPDTIKKNSEQLQKRRSKVRSIPAAINSKWSSKLEDFIDDLLDKTDKSDSIAEQVLQEQNRIVVEALRESGVPENIIQEILFFLEQLDIIQRLKDEYNSSINKSTQSLDKELLQKEPIRYHCRKFREQQKNIHREFLRAMHRKNFLDNLKREVALPYIEDQVNYQMNRRELDRQLTTAFTQQYPYRRFSYLLTTYPKQEVIYNQSSGYYSLKNTHEQVVDSLRAFWFLRVLLFVGLRMACDSFKDLCRNIWNGPLGLRIMWETRVFYPEYLLNERTGELGRSGYQHNTRTPIYVSIKLGLSDVSRYRQQFENSSDSGFLQKKYSRIVNILYVYVVVLLLKVVVYLCLLKPLIILINACASAFLIMTIWLWVPTLMLLYYLWSVLIYNNYTYTLFPIFRFVFSVIGILLLAIWNTVCLLIIHPTLALAVSVFALVRFFLRTGYDWLTFKIIRGLGRCPAKESFFAKRITAQQRAGVSSQSLKPSDVKTLLFAELEKIHLQIFKDKMLKIIYEPMREAETLLDLVARKMGTSRINYQKITDSCYYYVRRLDEQINDRTKHYPAVPSHVNIRFTEDEMQDFTKLTRQLLQEFMDDHPEIDLYKQFGLSRQKIHKLVSRIWKRIFRNSSQSIFTPLQRGDLVMMAEEAEMNFQEARPVFRSLSSRGAGFWGRPRMQQQRMALLEEADNQVLDLQNVQLQADQQENIQQQPAENPLPYKWDDEALYAKYRIVKKANDIMILLRLIDNNTAYMLEDSVTSVESLLVVHVWVEQLIKSRKIVIP